MSDPFIGEIRMFGGNFAPAGWALCDGQLVAIAENEALFALIGTTYGGDGIQNFALPDLRCRVPLHQGQGPGLSNRVVGQWGGQEQVTLNLSQMPAHRHTQRASHLPADPNATPRDMLARTQPAIYGAGSPSIAMSPAAVSPLGGNQAHANLPPFLVVNFIIALVGIFPSQF